MPPKRSIGKYPTEWVNGVIQSQVKTLANHKCESCGMQFHEDSNWSITSRTSLGLPVMGGCHHIDHDRSNNDLSNIVFLCQRCHLDVHRWSWKPAEPLPLAWAKQIPAWIINRNLPYQPNQQLELWSE